MKLGNMVGGLVVVLFLGMASLVEYGVYTGLRGDVVNLDTQISQYGKTFETLEMNSEWHTKQIASKQEQIDTLTEDIDLLQEGFIQLVRVSHDMDVKHEEEIQYLLDLLPEKKVVKL